MNKRTKTFKRLAILFTALSIAAMFGPMLYFCGLAFLSGAATVAKVALVSSISITLIMTAVSVMTKWAARSRIWVVILALFFCLENFLPIIITFAITQVLDELIFEPIAKYCRGKYSTNREIDKRGI